MIDTRDTLSKANPSELTEGLEALKVHLAKPFEITESFAEEHLAPKSHKQVWPMVKAALDGADMPLIEGRKGDLPNAFIIGAARSGTTTLAASLSNHPGVSVSRPKEPKFFGTKYSRGWDWYLKIFPQIAGATVRLEASTRYSCGAGLFRTTPKLVKRHIPEARFIFICRHPMKRIVSHWQNQMSKKSEIKVSFDALLNNRQLAAYIIGSSMYWTQLQAYRAEFSDDRILCLTFEDMVAQPVETARKITGFLGLDAAGDSSHHLLGEGSKFPHENKFGSKDRLDIPRPDWPPRMYLEIKDIVAPDARRFLEHISKPADYWDL